MNKELLAIPGGIIISCADSTEDGKVMVFVDDASGTRHLKCELPKITLMESSFSDKDTDILLDQVRGMAPIIMAAASDQRDKPELLFRVLGYNVFMPLKTEEPSPFICLFVTKNKTGQNGTKIWITSAHKAYTEENEANIPEKSLDLIKGTIEFKIERIINRWKEQYGQVSYLI